MNKKIIWLKKFLQFGFVILTFLFVFITFFYLYLLPNIVKSDLTHTFIKQILKKQYSLELEINNPYLKTSIAPQIAFGVENLKISSNNESLLLLDKIDVEIAFNKIFKKEIKLNKFFINNLTAKVDKIIEILPKTSTDKQKHNPEIKIDLLNSAIDLNYLSLTYAQNNNTFLSLIFDNVKFQKEHNTLKFNLNAEICKNGDRYVTITTKAQDEIKISNEKISLNNLKVLINKSKLNINSDISLDKISANIKSEMFYLSDVFKLINSDFVITNGSSLLTPLNNPEGNVNFDINLSDNIISGIIDVNNTGVQIKDINNIPVKVSDGKIKISKEKIDFQNLIGYYGKNKKNKIQINGDIKDYYKTFDSNIVIESLITNEFFKDYLSKIINNTTLFVSKPSKTKIIYKSKNNIMDIIWFAQIDKGVDFGLTNEKSALSDYDRAVLAEFQINDEKLNIKNINYYIASNIVRGVKLQPIIQMNGLMNLKGEIDNLGVAFGREMPSEFLNVFAGQNVFKKGTIKGKINVAFKNNIPYLDADMELNKTLIPSQRLALRHVKLKTNNDLIKLDMEGRFKRAKFKFIGNLKNELKPPFIIKKLTLDVDNIDIERILTSFNTQQNTEEVVEIESEDDLVDDNYMFDTNLVRIENCKFTLQNGNYKDLTFGNIVADLTLDENGKLEVKSNRFDIAQGISSLKMQADLKNLNYHLLLGVKNINSSLMAKVLLNLEREISGKATGLIELSGDKSLKLNGNIKFLINDGTIGKIGLVEYLMKIASVFRNPVVMISPATIMDIISIPEGRFDKIQGELCIKDNIVNSINIKSYSKSLSALIKGRFDLERHDASLRIYTRFSDSKKDTFNILRSLSLNSLAPRMKNKFNDINYYASELVELPEIEVGREKSQIFLTQVEGDIEHFNFLSSLKKIK